MGDSVSIDEPIEVFDCNGVSVVVALALSDWRGERDTLATAVVDAEESGERVGADAVAEIEDATDLVAETEGDDNAVTDGDRDIATDSEDFNVIEESRLTRAETECVSDLRTLIEARVDWVPPIANPALSEGTEDTKGDDDGKAVIVESTLKVVDCEAPRVVKAE